jgi:nitrile hydratase beta subunit-like protein
LGGVHDMGGSPAGPVARGQHEVEDWERLADAITTALDGKGIKTTDEHRRAQESLPPEEYASLSYYERWVAATETLLVEKGILSREEIDERAKVLERRWGGG